MSVAANATHLFNRINSTFINKAGRLQSDTNPAEIKPYYSQPSPSQPISLPTVQSKPYKMVLEKNGHIFLWGPPNVFSSPKELANLNCQQKEKKACSKTIVKTPQLQNTSGVSKSVSLNGRSEKAVVFRFYQCWVSKLGVTDPGCLVSMALFPLGLSPGASEYPFVG